MKTALEFKNKLNDIIRRGAFTEVDKFLNDIQCHIKTTLNQNQKEELQRANKLISHQKKQIIDLENNPHAVSVDDEMKKLNALKRAIGENAAQDMFRGEGWRYNPGTDYFPQNK